MRSNGNLKKKKKRQKNVRFHKHVFNLFHHRFWRMLPFFFLNGEKIFDVSLVFWVFPPSFYTRSTFAGTELDFRLKLTKQTKNNPPQEREREGVKDRDGRKEGRTEGRKGVKKKSTQK